MNPRLTPQPREGAWCKGTPLCSTQGCLSDKTRGGNVVSSRDLLASLLPPFDLEAVNSSHSRDKHSAEASVYSTQYLVSGRGTAKYGRFNWGGRKGHNRICSPYHLSYCLVFL